MVKEICPNLEYRIAIACCRILGLSCQHYGNHKTCKKYKEQQEYKKELTNICPLCFNHWGKKLGLWKMRIYRICPNCSKKERLVERFKKWYTQS